MDLPFFDDSRASKKKLTPVMIDYIDRTIEPISKREIIHSICSFYYDYLKKAFQMLGREGNLSDIILN